LFALVFLLVPEQASTFYGVTSNEASVIHSRFFGATLLGVGAILLLARNSSASEARRAILNGGLVLIIAELVISLWAVLMGGLGPMGWTSVVLMLILLIWWFMVMRKGDNA
jgi:hypothetical protein